MNQPNKGPDDREWLSEEAAMLHRAEEAAGRGPSKRKLIGCAVLSFMAAAAAIGAIWFLSAR